MIAQTEDSSVFEMLSPPAPEAKEHYWWRTTGRDIANMLRAAKYPKTTQHSFLSYYLNVVCPLMGGAPDQTDPAQALSWTWDGSTHEYSFEFKESDTEEAGPEVRFVLDACRLRPVDPLNPLSPLPTDILVDTFAARAPGFDSTWYRALKRHFDYSHLPAGEQRRLGAEAGHLSPFLVGFDISREVPAAAPPSALPVVGKAYFLPCLAAAAEKKSRFAVIRDAIRGLPDVDARPNILSALAAVEAYLATKPAAWADGARFLATDFLSPDRARLKVYLRCPSTSFDDIWDYFTLGGRIPGLDDARDKYRDFVEVLGGVASREDGGGGDGVETGSRKKLTTLYFSIDDRSPFPSPKIAFCARNFAVNDAVVVQGLDSWLAKHGRMGERGSPVESLVEKVFTHRKLDEKAGIFTFIGLARKSHDKPDLSIQTYLCPELYYSSRS